MNDIFNDFYKQRDQLDELKETMQKIVKLDPDSVQGKMAQKSLNDVHLMEKKD